MMRGQNVYCEPTCQMQRSSGSVPQITGDVIGVSIDSEGWTASITIKGVSTGGSYAMGLGTNNVTSASTKIKFTVVSLGFDDSGNATTITRIVWGTKQLRKAYPNEATNDETVSGSDVIVRVTLSDYIYQKDNTGAGNSGIAVKVDILSGFYTQGGTPNNAKANYLCTNNSVAPYPKVIGNWSWPGFERSTTDNVPLRCVAFHHDGQSGRPVRCVKFTITDGSSTGTSTVTAPAIDSGMSLDEMPVVEYFTTINSAAASIANGTEITCNFIAYPWVGDAASCLDTSAGTAAPTPLAGPIKFVTDGLGTYGVTMALVDTATGNDATGQAYDEFSYDPATALRFLTIGKAAAAIAAYNNTNRSRNDVGAGIVELEAGNYAWLGSSNTYGNTPKTWITIRPKTGVARASVVINATSGNGDISDRIKLENLTITTATANTFTNVNAIWCHKCDFNSTGTGLFNTTAGVVWITQGKVTRFDQGFRSFSTNNLSFALVRGNDMDGAQYSTLCYTVIGNKRTTRSTPNATCFLTEINGMTGPQAVNFVIAFNSIRGWEVGAGGLLCIETGHYLSNSVGGAIVQNLFEQCSGSNGMGDIASSDNVTTNTPVDNLILWHNTFLGQRNFIGYNDATSIRKDRRYWSLKNNYWDRSANKNDVFSPQDLHRIGCWPVSFQVGATGNCHEQNMFSLPDNFFFEFDGLSCYEPNGSQGTLTHAGFVARKSYNGVADGAGTGDYHPGDTSILTSLPIDFLLPFDLDGIERIDGIANATGVFGTGVFTPASVSGMAAWYKGEELSLANAAAVTSWADSSGNGNTLTQGTGAQQPTYRTNIVNGLPIVRFDGTNDMLANAAPSGFGSQSGQTVFAVVLTNSVADSTFHSIAVTRPQFNELRLFKEGGTSKYLWQYLIPGGSTTAVFDAGLAELGSFRLITGVFDDSSNALDVYRSGVAGTGATDAAAFSSTVINIGARDASNDFWNGDIAEVIIYSRALSSGERALVEAYLTSKFNL